MQIFTIGGIVLIAWSVFSFGKNMIRLLTCRGKTEGVFAYADEHTEVGSDRKTHICYTPVYSYTVDGTTYEAKAKEYSYNSGKFKVGSTATIQYNLNNPKECVVNGRTGDLYVSVMMIIFGAVLLWLGK